MPLRKKWLRIMWAGIRTKFCEMLQWLGASALLSVVLWLVLLSVPGYKIRPMASIRRAIASLAVMQSSPDLRLFTQYPRDYGIEHQKGWVDDGGRLRITSQKAYLRIGVWNNEPLAIKGVRLVLIPPQNVVLAVEKGYQPRWLKTQFLYEDRLRYEYRDEGNIYADTGWVIAEPIEFAFPKIGTYAINYIILSEDWSPIKGRTFVVERVE